MLIQKLEKRFYPRAEVAEIMGLVTNDKNFANKVRTRLNNWGYEYNYSRNGVEITKVPTSAEEKLNELLIRKLNLNIQMDLKGFSVMMYLLDTDYEFRTSPWKTRETILFREYGMCIAESTMRNWARRLISDDVLMKSSDTPEVWRSYKDVFNRKCQERVSGNEEQMKEYEEYKAKRSQYLEEADKAYQEETGSYLPSPTRWKDTFSRLWNEFQCCYYNVKPLEFGAWFKDSDYEEIFSLAEDIVQNLIIEWDEQKKSKFVF